MQGDVAGPVGEALSIALGLPVRELRELEPDVQQEALIALPGRIGEPVVFSTGSCDYLACRYHPQRHAVLILGPYRLVAGPVTASDELDAAGLERAGRALQQAVEGLRRATDASVQRIELASQIEVSSRAILAISSALSLDTVLNRIVDLAREISGARYAALGVPGPSGELESFLTSGISSEEASAIAHPPAGRGLLGLLLREPGTVRLANLAEHPASVGFPANHPPMRSFLGVSIMAHGKVLGNLYLTEKRTGRAFTDDDARLVEELARHAAVAIENAHLYQQVGQQQQRLQLILDQLPEATLLAEREPERVTLANQHASNLLGWQIETPIPLETFLRRNPRLGPDDSPMPAESLPMMQSLRSGERVSHHEVRIKRADGQVITALVNSAPLRGPG
ncbi:MAG TPA: GAF domain-containing protein, partial [Thermomicrobiales bacterium]|nr:GAF domain-containing protein [Thermomicrobiales bacterium]